MKKSRFIQCKKSMEGLYDRFKKNPTMQSFARLRQQINDLLLSSLITNSENDPCLKEFIAWTQELQVKALYENKDMLTRELGLSDQSIAFH